MINLTSNQHQIDHSVWFFRRFFLSSASGPYFGERMRGFGFFAMTLLKPQFLGPLNRIWAAFGAVLHKVVNPIIMGFLFYLIVTPTSLLMRLMGKRPLDLQFEHQRKSYWIESTPPSEPSVKSMRDQF